MKNKGFTLIEILGVITLLAILSTIIILAVNKPLKDSKEKLYQTQIENIKAAASNWRTDNIELIPQTGYYTITLENLQNDGYINSDIKDPRDDSIMLPSTQIQIGMNNITVNTP